MTQDIRTIRIATQGPAGPACLYPRAAWSAGSVPYARSSVLPHNGGVWLALRANSVEPSASVPDDWASWLDFSGSLATLGDDGKIPTAQLPASILGALNYQGTWNASTNSPSIPAAASGNKGWYYKVSVVGTTTISGINDWRVGDWIVSNGATWDKIDNTDAVLSVAGRTGAVTLAASDISGLAASATADTTNASNITSGTLGVARGGTGAATARAAAAALSMEYVIAQSAAAVSCPADTTEDILATIAIPANALGSNGLIKAWTLWSATASANAKNSRIRFGASGAGTSGTQYMNGNYGATGVALTGVQQIINRNATNSQIGFQVAPSSFQASANALVTSAIDTTAATEIVITGQKASSGETLTLEAYYVSIVYKA